MTDRRTTIIDKVKALLSKTTASGCTEEEMLSALKMARAWQDAHEISDEELQLSRDEKVLLHDEGGADIRDSNKIKGYLTRGVEKFCNVQIYRKRNGNGGLTFLGFKLDIDYATWLLDHFADYVHTALFNHLLDCDCLAPKERKEEIRGFVIGCCGRIKARMDALCKQSEKARTSSGKELVVITDRAIKDYMKVNDIHLCSGGSSRAAFSPGGYDAGRSAGDGAGFGRPVSGAGAVLRIGKA